MTAVMVCIQVPCSGRGKVQSQISGDLKITNYKSLDESVYGINAYLTMFCSCSRY